jgi:hypothetical protein
VTSPSKNALLLDVLLKQHLPLGFPLLPVRHIDLHDAFTKIFRAGRVAVTRTLAMYLLPVFRSPRSLLLGLAPLLLFRGYATSKEQQDDQITHVGLPFISDVASIYFFRKSGCPPLSVIFGLGRNPL